MYVVITIAKLEDVKTIVQMLADDKIGNKREDLTLPLNQTYIDAFHNINDNPNCFLTVAKLNNTVVGTLQLSILPGLSRKGMLRSEIEAVRVSSKYRGNKIGHKLCEWAINKSRQLNCGLVQLTSDKTRIEAQNFYKKMGFVASHTGMKLMLIN